MTKITSQLQALEAIRRLYESAPLNLTLNKANERLHLAAYETALEGIAHAVPLPAPTRKAARDLVPGDVLVFDHRRVVVLYVRQADSNIAVATFGLGDFSAEKAVGLHAPDSQFTVEAPAGLTPVQAAADRLLGYARNYLSALKAGETGRDTTERKDLQALFDELDPPKPPTLEEVTRALDLLVGHAGTSVEPKHLDNARKLLARVPKE